MVVKLTCDIWFQKGEKRPVGLGQPFRYDGDVLSGQRSHWWGFLQGAGLEGPAVPAGGVPGVFGLCSSAGALQTTGP